MRREELAVGLARAGRWADLEAVARAQIERLERARPAWDGGLARALVAAHALALERVPAGPSSGIVPVG